MPYVFNAVFEYFIKNPYGEVYLRDLGRKLKRSPYAVKTNCDFFLREGLITEERRANLRYFKANMKNILFKELKVSYNIRIILKSGLLDFILKNIGNVSAIVLFGSMAKGENDEASDIDLLVIGRGRHPSLYEIEKRVDCEISLHVMTWSEWNKNYKTNRAFYFDIIAYGRTLYGDLPIIRDHGI